MRIKKWLKQIASCLPVTMQNSLKRAQFSSQIRRGTFATDELEFDLLDKWVTSGDWAIDIGANIGHYTLRLASLVGKTGRVVAFEPIPATFDLLASNVARAGAGNVTLINAATSSATGIVGMTVPTFDTGLDNFYMANISDDGDIYCMTISVDSLKLPERVSLVKIDAEGHEMIVLDGMRELLLRDKPTLIVEVSSDQIQPYLESIGYQTEFLPGSSNLIFKSAG